MASFDIKSSFTNIPVGDTNELILHKLVPHQDSLFQGMNRVQVDSILKNCTQNNLLRFNGKTYCPYG